ncbi:MAG: aldo/keto reductase [Rhodobacteraceae bacterium]|nr:aldo/keto reductase [Paracoccaceae bacterium]
MKLADGNDIPPVGLGVAGIPVDLTTSATLAAINAGYRLIDTAVIYHNEAEVGAALAKTNVPRDDLFIATKVWPDRYGYDAVNASFRESMTRLGLDRLDLYMLHWPAPMLDKYVESWRALIDLQRDGWVTSIGVSNFFPAQLQRLADETGVMPVVNQIELHPYSQRLDEQAFHAKNNIATQCWSPLGRSRCLDDPVINAIATKHVRTPAQVVLRWHFEAGRIAIPRSKSPDRIQQNFDIFGFALDADDRSQIAALNKGLDGQLGPDPEIAR